MVMSRLALQVLSMLQQVGSCGHVKPNTHNPLPLNVRIFLLAQGMLSGCAGVHV